MKIKKVEEEITYKQETTFYVFEINNKPVRIYVNHTYDTISEEYDTETNIDENDLKKLTELEEEFVGEMLGDYIGIEIGESFESGKSECWNCGAIVDSYDIDYLGDQKFECIKCKKLK